MTRMDAWVGPDRAALEELADSLREVDYTVDAVAALLGMAGEAALSRADRHGADYALAQADPSVLRGLVRLFILGLDVAVEEVGPALVSSLVDAGFVAAGSSGRVRARLDLRPYGEQGSASWLVVSDLGADVRPGPLHADHVLGIGAAATTLAQAGLRRPVQRALDVGTGCGVQALHLSQHAEHVTVTDLSERALWMAAMTAALNGLEWDARHGDLLEPVAGQRFDQIVANPPFVVGPAGPGARRHFDYRDSGLSGDEVSRRLIQGIGEHLQPGGTGQLLANWAIAADEPWTQRLEGWLDGNGCDAWVWQREVADPGEYVALWLRDAGLRPTDPDYGPEYDRWRRWFDEQGVLAVGMGLVTMRRVETRKPVVRLEDVPQQVLQPAGAAIGRWFDETDWLANHTDDQLRSTRLAVAPNTVLSSHAVLGEDGWRVEIRQLRQAGGLRWEIECDQHLARLLGGLRGEVSLGVAADLLAAHLGASADSVFTALVPPIRDLIGRGIVLLVT